jgi:hypothetical protein
LAISASWQGRPISVSYMESTFTKDSFYGFITDYSIGQHCGGPRMFDIRVDFLRI